MTAVRRILTGLERLNDVLLALGRSLAWMCVAIMVATILLQVFFRYVLNNPLPWPEEVARIFMLWMTAFAAPSAYRWAGFVSIEMLKDALPPALRRLLTFLLLFAAFVVLAKLAELSLEFFQRGFRTTMASIWYPLIGTGEDGSFGIVRWVKLSRAWVYLSMPVLYALLTLVNVEMILREIGRTFGNEADFPDPPRLIVAAQE